MAFSPNFADLVRNYTTSTGTDDFVLGAAVNGFTSFTDACKVGDCFYYSAVAVDYPGDTEVGRGSLLDGGVISREPFNGTKTDFKSGTKSVSLVAAGEWFSEVEALRANGVGMINVKSFGAKGDSDRDGIAGTDDTAAIQAAIDHVGTTGGTLYFPAGIYKFSTTLRLANHVRYLGDGVDSAVTKGTVLKYTGTSDAIQINNPSNGSNNANISIENLAVHCTTVTPGKACIADNCSSQLKIRGCVFGGADRLLILDQTELADIVDCDFGVIGGTCAIWLVNGETRTPGNESGFTNRISVQRCQINSGGGGIGIIDDGGNTHSFVDNNYNGFTHQIRAAGVLGLQIIGGEFEAASDHVVYFDSNTYDATIACGGCGPVLIQGGEYISSSGKACIRITSGTGPFTILSPFFGGSGSAKVVGVAANVNALYSIGVQNGGGGATFDGMAANHWEVGNNGLGAITITTNLAQADLKTADVDWCRANGPGIPTSGFGLELIHNGQTGNGGLASIVAYDRSLSEWQELQVGASAIKLQTGGSEIAVVDPTGISVNGKISASDLTATAKGLRTSYLLAQSAMAVSHSGDTNEVVLASVAVPANSMGANGRVEVQARLTLSNSASNKTVNLNFGGTTFATKVQSGAAIDSVQGDIANRGDAGSQVGSAQFYSGNSMSTSGVSTSAADTSKDQTLSITAQLASAGDTVTLESYRFILHPAD